MSCDFLALANRGVQALSPYQPGKPIDELERELGLSGIIKLASNENPLGPSESVVDAMQLELESLSRYPDGNAFGLKNSIAYHHNVTSEQITIGNGSNDILELIGRAFLQADRSEVVFSAHSFAVYPLVTQACGAKAVVIPAKKWASDLELMADAINSNTRLIFVANPNNPTGTWNKADELVRFLDQVPTTALVVLDEAYFEYVEHRDYPKGIELLKRYSNLIVTRTFSKAYGLAALRVGYSVSNTGIAEVLNRVRQPFNVNSLAQAAAIAALDDEKYLQESRDVNRQGLQQLINGCDQLGLNYIPSVGNFLAVEFDSVALPIYEKLLQQGIIVRPIANYGMPNFLRVSVGLEEENHKFLQALERSF